MKKYQIKYVIITIVCLLMIFVSCESDNGIAPKPVTEQFGFGGNIIFYGVWPDSIKRVFLVAFKDPLLDASDFVITNIGYLSVELLLGVPNYNYSSLDSSYLQLIQDDNPPSDYHYVAIAQQSTEILSFARKDWFVTGVYYADGDTTIPGVLSIPKDTYVDNISIYCDFDDPPPQPPGGN